MPVTRFENFDLEIARIGTSVYVKAQSGAGETGRSEFRMPMPVEDLIRFYLKVPDTASADEALNQARDFGAKLFDSLFSKGELRDCLVRSLEQVKAEGACLRLRFHTNEAPEMAEVPWEFLYDPDRRSFLALDAQVSIVRYLELSEAVRRVKVGPPVRVLVAMASPRGAPALDFEREWKKINGAVSRLVRGGHVVMLAPLEHASFSALQGRLREGAPHVLHYVGHGRLDEAADRAELLFEDGSGNPAPVEASHLGEMLQNAESLRLVVLNACEGGRVSVRGPFAGLAQRLVASRVPAVVAMQTPIRDDAAVAFSHELYGALSSGYTIDAALVEARVAMKSSHGLQWGTPVLYSRAPDGILFENKPAPGQRPIVNTALGCSAVFLGLLWFLRHIEPGWMGAGAPVGIVTALGALKLLWPSIRWGFEGQADSFLRRWLVRPGTTWILAPFVVLLLGLLFYTSSLHLGLAATGPTPSDRVWICLNGKHAEPEVALTNEATATRLFFFQPWRQQVSLETEGYQPVSLGTLRPWSAVHKTDLRLSPLPGPPVLYLVAGCSVVESIHSAARSVGHRLEIEAGGRQEVVERMSESFVLVGAPSARLNEVVSNQETSDRLGECLKKYLAQHGMPPEYEKVWVDRWTARPNLVKFDIRGVTTVKVKLVDLQDGTAESWEFPIEQDSVFTTCFLDSSSNIEVTPCVSRR